MLYNGQVYVTDFKSLNFEIALT
ncbi:hypothetical protein FLAVO9AF_200025 [Flavobacterium sp. 9AF]|nr:hypothetical protein FLAVO9AF_200025 [Flavobacterium sp. 9AF]